MARRQMQPQPKFMRIEFENRGQDFHYFMLEYHGIRPGVHDVHVPVYRVTEAGPFQNFLWRGRLIDAATINEQCRPAILMQDDGEWGILDYQVTRVQRSNMPMAVLP
jgi:hypothetical protein